MRITRRTAIKALVGSGSALGTARAISSLTDSIAATPPLKPSVGAALASSGRSANDRIRIAIVGVRGRGSQLMRSILQVPSENVEVVALCDVDASALDEVAAKYEKLAGNRVAKADDMRRLLDDQSIDAVIHATPTHWHALGGIWTLQAGKDAYIEKPLAHNIWEGKKLVEAARKYDRIVQNGTQCRSSPEIREGIQKLREGVIGEVYLARAIAHKYRPNIGRSKNEAVPPGLNYDMWRGPAPMRPYTSNRLHYNWHWFWDTGNGDMGNLGVHSLDVVRLGMGLDLPTKIQSMGGHFIFNDDKETPNCQTSVFQQFVGRNVSVEHSIRNGCTNAEAGMGDTIPFTLGDRRDACGPIFYGSEGYMAFPDYSSYYTYLGRDRTPGPKLVGTREPMSNIPHLENFFQATYRAI